MSEEWQKYVNDPRTVCKYGEKCYQKNSEHHKTYKHPPLVKKKTKLNRHLGNRFKPYSKDTKQHNTTVNDTKNEIDQVKEKQAVVKKDDKHEATVSTTENNYSPDKDGSKSILTLPENLLYYDKDVNHSIFKELFLVEMPTDFFKFYECLIEDGQPADILASVNLQLIGPYDLLMGTLPIIDDKELYLIHWRFFYDPPEFQSVLKVKGKSQYHIGYFRDSPDENPVFLASNNCAKDCHLTPVAENIFGAVYLYLQNEKKRSPFTSVPCQKLMEKVKQWADTYNFSIKEYNMKTRLSKSVTKTFHSAGIVVPYNRNTQLGYRPLVETDANIKNLFARLKSAETQNEKDTILSKLQPVITYAMIAVDECDFGTGLEVGIDLFCSGLKELEHSALSALNSAYSLLNREAFGEIIKAHLKYRRRGPDVSLLSLYEN